MVQILQLGLEGSETTLPDESRINTQGADVPYYNEARSASKKLHVDFIRLVEGWTITWDTISVANYELINDIVKLQYSTGSFLSFIYTDSTGTETTLEVRASIGSKGSLMQVADWYNQAVSLILEEV